MAFRLAQRYTVARNLIRPQKIARTAPIITNKRYAATAETEIVESKPGRWQVTGEVIISKIFPAGFCWQGASLIAGAYAFAPESAAFALITGFGDALGVYVGHRTLYLVKSAIGTKVDQSAEHQIGSWLACSAFLSGTAWQPVVNMLSAAGLSFTPAAVATTFICGSFFFGGLRVGRSVFNVGKADSTNFVKDAQLGFSIGGATGAFVGTDISFAGNWLAPLVGVTEATADVTGMALAGCSTSMGFATIQGAQNVAVPSRGAWNDA
eukprot:UN28503